MKTGRWLTFVLAALLAACGDIPQPFRHDGPPPSLARPKMTRGLTVRPILALPDLGPEMVKALETKDIPAIVNSGSAFGHVLAADLVEGGLAWTLTAPDGTELSTFNQAIPRAVWRTPDERWVKLMAAEAAAAVAARLNDPDALPRKDAAKAELTRPKVRIEPLAGLPGDGDKALTQSLKRALAGAGFDLVPSGGAYVVRGVASVTPAKSGDDLLAISWQVKRAVDGGQMAAIDQEGEVPKGRLAGPWGGLASDIAEGGAAGIIQVIRTAERSGKAAPETNVENQPSQFTEMRPADIGRADSSEQKAAAETPPEQAQAAVAPDAKKAPAKTVKKQTAKQGGKAVPAKKTAKKTASSTKPNAPRTPKVPAR